MKKKFQLISIITLAYLLSGCSVTHKFEIKNDTDKIVKIEYKILDEKGIFKKRFIVIDPIQKSSQTIKFTGEVVSFELYPNQTAQIGRAKNTSYYSYKSELEYDAKFPSKSFINIESLFIIADNLNLQLDPSKLEDLMLKNTARIGRISVDNVLKKYPSFNP